MVTVNDPLIIALIFIIFLAAAKWMEWFLFRNEEVTFETKEKVRGAVHENKTLKRIGKRLKDIFVFGRADLKRPWYIALPGIVNYAIYYALLASNISSMSESGWFLILAGMVILIVWFDIFTMLRVNKEYFSVGDRKKRYLRVQAAQAALAVVVMVIMIGVMHHVVFSENEYPDRGLQESVDWVIEPTFGAEWPEFSEGLAAVGYQGETGFIDKSGTIVIPLQYNAADSFHEGLAAVQKDWRWGYIDQKGNVVIPFQYEEAYYFDGAAAPVKKDGEWSVIDRNGMVKFKTDYEKIYPYHEGVAKVELRGQKYEKQLMDNLIGADGNLLFQKDYDLLGNFSEGCIFVHDNQSGKDYYLDRDERKAIPQNYNDATDFSDGAAAVLFESGEYALIDHIGTVIKELSEEEYNNFMMCHEGLVLINNGELDGSFSDWDKVRFGFKDVYGDVLIPAVFYDATPPSEGLIGLDVGGSWGFIENPIPKAARGVDQELWKADRTQIGSVEGLPVYAGELESCAYGIKEKNPELTGIPAYKKAFENIKIEKAFEKYGSNIDPEKIRYQIGDTYYKKLLLESFT
jgi:hypothetical protein